MTGTRRTHIPNHFTQNGKENVKGQVTRIKCSTRRAVITERTSQVKSVFKDHTVSLFQHSMLHIYKLICLSIIVRIIITLDTSNGKNKIIWRMNLALNIDKRNTVRRSLRVAKSSQRMLSQVFLGPHLEAHRK